MPAAEKEREGCHAADKFTVVLKTAGLNANELWVYSRQKGLFPEQVDHWPQDTQDANEKLVLAFIEQK